MPLGRRRTSRDSALAGALDAFEATVTEIETAKETITEAMPRPRREGMPLAEALYAFEATLTQARETMGGWRRPETEDAWRACATALDECLVAAERLRLEAPAMDFEQMALTLGDLIAPLDAFADAERALRRAARRTRRPGRS